MNIILDHPKNGERDLILAGFRVYELSPCANAIKDLTQPRSLDEVLHFYIRHKDLCAVDAAFKHDTTKPCNSELDALHQFLFDARELDCVGPPFVV